MLSANYSKLNKGFYFTCQVSEKIESGLLMQENPLFGNYLHYNFMRTVMFSREKTVLVSYRSSPARFMNMWEKKILASVIEIQKEN